MDRALEPITPESVSQAIAQVRDDLAREQRPAYLIDTFFRIWECNRLTLLMLGKDDLFKQQVLGKIQTFDLVLDPQYGIRSQIPTESFDPFIAQQLTRALLILSQRYGPEVTNDILGPLIQRYEELRNAYGQIDHTNLRSRYGRSNVTFSRGTHQLNFEIVPDVLVADDRFFLVEYHPSDHITSAAIEQLRRQILGEQTLSLAIVSSALRSWSSLTGLSSSPLLELKSVAMQSATKPKVDALQHLLTQCIEGLAPNSIAPIRSKTILKYEILRMMAYEGATEDQIMWDLGFEPDSDFWARQNPNKARTPRFPYTGKGDYSATSRASFKRLKAQAVEDLRWRLEEMERQVRG